jgi:hypothetical protein
VSSVHRFIPTHEPKVAKLSVCGKDTHLKTLSIENNFAGLKPPG